MKLATLKTRLARYESLLAQGTTLFSRSELYGILQKIYKLEAQIEKLEAANANGVTNQQLTRQLFNINAYSVLEEGDSNYCLPYSVVRMGGRVITASECISRISRLSPTAIAEKHEIIELLFTYGVPHANWICSQAWIARCRADGTEVIITPAHNTLDTRFWQLNPGIYRDGEGNFFTIILSSTKESLEIRYGTLDEVEEIWAQS